MQSMPLLRPLLRDDALTRGLGDAEARLLVEWLVDWAELLADAAPTEQDAWERVTLLSQRARAIGRFVWLWSRPGSRGAAAQLAAVERFGWPMPAQTEEPPEVMSRILAWENAHIFAGPPPRKSSPNN